jgi:hypothetical protein
MGKIVYNRGTTYTMELTYSNDNGVDGATAMFTVKTAQFDTSTDDSTAVFKQDQVMSANAANFEITPDDFADTQKPANYFYDFKVLDADGDIFLIDEGTFVLKASPTNRLT